MNLAIRISHALAFDQLTIIIKVFAASTRNSVSDFTTNDKTQFEIHYSIKSCLVGWQCCKKHVFN